jgi:hypothetical protein
MLNIIVLSLYYKPIKSNEMKTSEMIIWVNGQRAKGLTDNKIKNLESKLLTNKTKHNGCNRNKNNR